MTFADRRQAGRLLAARLEHLAGPGGGPAPNVVVLGLPRGGVPVAAEVAATLHAPLDVVVVRKLGVPGRPELAMGAIAEQDIRVLEPLVIRRAGVSAGEVDEIERRERAQLEQRTRRLRSSRPAPSLSGRIAVLIDDGIATGATMTAACRAVRRRGAGRVVVAVPVAAPEAVAYLREEADDVVCLQAPAYFQAVGLVYNDFQPVPDAEVVRLLGAAQGVTGPEGEERS